MSVQYEDVIRLSDSVVFAGNLREHVVHFLTHHEAKHTAAHSICVARRACEIAEQVGVDPHAAEQAGLLHDISAVIPVAARLSAAQAWSVPILPEEEAVPLLIHQKLSVIIAREIFDISDEPVLAAIGCHTTLKAAPSALDMLLFIADKLAWDQAGQPPYRAVVEDALCLSLEQAAFTYLDYVWQRRNQLRVIHPWLREAYIYLAARQ